MTGAAHIRRYTFKLYPTRGQAEAMDRQRGMHAALYNALLQQRIEAYRRRGMTLTYYDQCKELTALRNDPEIGAEWRALSSDAMAATAQRVDRAMQAFFHRARAGAGAQSGFPRFKRGDDFPGWSFRQHGSGWKVIFDAPRANGRQNGRLYVKGAPGTMKLRGRFPCAPETIKTSEILYRGGDWWLSIVVVMTARQRPMGRAEGMVRFNLIDGFARVSRANGGCAAGPEDVTDFVMADGRIIPVGQGGCTEPGAAAPETGGDRREVAFDRGDDAGAAAPETGGDRRRLISAGMPWNGAAAIAPLQQRMARCKRGSHKYRKLRRMKARLEARAARRRREGIHLWTTALVAAFGKLTIVKPTSIKAATASGRGNDRDWGAAVATKAAVNRHILGQAPATAIQMLEYKLAERGGLIDVVSDPDAPADLGNAVVAAAKANRKLKRSIKRASRSAELHRDRQARA